MNKTIILTWTKTPCNITDNINCNYWGLGDVIRGTIHMYNLTKELGINLFVDTQLHSLNAYLKKRQHPYEDFVLNNKEKVICLPFSFNSDSFNNFVRFINDDNNYNDGILLITTNGPIKINHITEDCKDFIKNILTPNDDFMRYIDEKMKEIPYKEYNILHYRFGDTEMIKNSNEKHIEFLDNVKKHITKTTILISDSHNFKVLVKDNLDLFMFDTKICHLGHPIEKHDLRETLFEFFITTKAKKIKTFTVHNWLSGFVRIANIIYDVPLIRISR